MKDQYVADIGDYGKYSLLRAFAKEGVCVGVNWYYTSNDESNDGKFKEYLDDTDRFGNYCKEVFSILSSIPKDKRLIRTIEESEIIPNAHYYHDIVEFEGTPADRYNKRIEWSKKGQKELASAELVYLDPDNGVLTNKRYSRRKIASKYVFRRK